MSTEIATLENTEIQLAFTSPNGIDILIDRIRKEAQSEVPDLSTAKGRARIASLAHKVSKTKVLVDDYGKELVAEEKKRLALIDADRKKWRDTCDAIRDEIRKPLTDWEAAEESRIANHKAGLAGLRGLVQSANGADAETIRHLISGAEAVQLGESWDEFAAEAGKAKDETLSALRASLASREKYEAEQAEARAKAEAEAAKLREQDAERRRVEAEERAAREAKEAAERAERERIAAIEAERQRAEQRRIDDERKATEEQAAREADKENRRKVNRSILDAMTAVGISEDHGKLLISAIAGGKVPNVKIVY